MRLPPGPGRRPGRAAAADERGYVTAEAAVVLPALVAVLSMTVGVVGALGAQLRCVDAARGAARAAARGESDAYVRAAALRAAPRGATVVIRRSGEQVEVVVRARLVTSRLLPAVDVSSTATAELERR